MNQIASIAGSNGQEPGTRSHVKILIKVSGEEHPGTIQISSRGTTLKGAWEETTLLVECAQTLRGEDHAPRKPAKLLPSPRDKFCALLWQATAVSIKAKVGGTCIPKANTWEVSLDPQKEERSKGSRLWNSTPELPHSTALWPEASALRSCGGTGLQELHNCTNRAVDWVELVTSAPWSNTSYSGEQRPQKTLRSERRPEDTRQNWWISRLRGGLLHSTHWASCDEVTYHSHNCPSGALVSRGL